MKRANKKYTVDWPNKPAPKVGDVFFRLTPTNQSAGYYRVAGVAVVNTRKPLDSGYTARYRINADFIGDAPPSGRQVDWTLHGYKRPRLPPKPPGRLSPLL